MSAAVAVPVCGPDGLLQFVVGYRIAEEGPQEQLFQCWAEDPSHAREQARDAYPDAVICDTRLASPPGATSTPGATLAR